ncbi:MULTISPECIES: sensor histidine kinase [unclassified Treponema]|uniref:histidine kinase AtcS n=1 Tax=unclassified Treponema TaxID=2638727 RepID=UPI0020A576E0|nr:MULTISPECIES: GHKL domain-containing protein [unclassified Treponema]UTC67074.1 GHKL domain-containing protein [Treponema sp. OMZ 789]UTC69805.1 GHKL domain-containing protein [Treponema sp. OMZ 790]UTC72519.1 GHKL domain-containing protein [Treponema sp. OMZ 791]
MFIFIVVLILILLMFILLYFLIKRAVNKRFDDFQNGLINKYYQDVDSIYKKMRGWRHDFHNHLQVMKAYLEFKNYDELENYLSNLTEDLIKVDSVIKTGNLMSDAILNTKTAIALSHDIKLNIKASIPQNIALSDLELCVIIGNLFDNAIEGTLSLKEKEKRFIRVYIRKLNGNLYISFTNSCEGRRKKTQGKFLTTKQGKDHGFGSSRIDAIVKKYSAFINRQSEEGAFAVELMFPLVLSSNQPF